MQQQRHMLLMIVQFRCHFSYLNFNQLLCEPLILIYLFNSQK